VIKIENEKFEEIKQVMRTMLDIDEKTAIDCINYIFTQLNEQSFLATISLAEFNILVSSATKELMRIIFLKHYSRDLVSRKAFATATRNLILLLYTRPLLGNDREILLKEIESKKNTIIQTH